MLCCRQCGDLYPSAATNEGDFVPIGGARGGRCHECGCDEFERVTLTPSD